MLDITKLQAQGVKQLRGLAFVYEVPARKVLLQRTLWPPYEGGTGSSDRTYVLVGIMGLLPLAGGPGLMAAMSRIVAEVTTLSVPSDAWKFIQYGDPTTWKAPVPTPEHAIPLVAYAAAVPSLAGVTAKVGDCVGAVSVDQVCQGFGADAQALLFGVPEMIAKGMALVSA